MSDNPSTRRGTLVLADDNLDVLEEVSSLLSPEFDVLRAVAEGNALVQATAELSPDVVVSDLHMPGLSGIEAGRRILNTGLCRSVVALSMYNEPDLVRKALSAGIRGYVLKVDAGEELILAIHTVLGGGQYLSRSVAAKL